MTAACAAPASGAGGERAAASCASGASTAVVCAPAAVASRSPRRGSTTAFARPASRGRADPSPTRARAAAPPRRGRARVSHRTRDEGDVALDARRRAVCVRGPRATTRSARRPNPRAAPPGAFRRRGRTAAAGRTPRARSRATSATPARAPARATAARTRSGRSPGAYRARVQDLLGRARAPEPVDRVDRVPTRRRRRGTPSTNFSPPRYGNSSSFSRNGGRPVALGAARRARSTSPRLRYAVGVVGHQRRGGALGQRRLRERRVVGQSLAAVEPEALVLERVHELVGERDLEQRPASRPASRITTSRFERSS